MKKLLALLLAMLMMFSLVACGGGNADDGDDKSSSTPVVVGQDDENDESEDKEPLVLEGKDAYVVCVKNGSNLVISSIKDIKGLSVGVAYSGDGEKIAEYYEANVVGYGGENDAFSELTGGTSLDCVIVKKIAGEDYQSRGSAKIILDPIVIE